MVLDHLGIAVTNVARSRAFYEQTLQPLGIECVAEVEDGWLGFGRGDKADFWFGEDETSHSPMHIAFRATSRAEVEAFYQAAIAAGGTDNGKPGLRPEYHAGYYGAFVLDPDGHNIEAVCHG